MQTSTQNKTLLLQTLCDANTDMIIYRLIKYSAISLIKGLVRLGFSYPLVKLCARDVIDHKASRTNFENQNLVTILALNPKRFRGDLECLAQTGHYRILKMPFNWQGRFYNWFYSDHKSISPLNPDNDFLVKQNKYQNFLKHFLPKFFSYLKIDIVIGAAIHYRQDYDLASVSHQLGIPTFILHREGNLASAEIRKVYENRCRNYNAFHGTHLVVQNDIQKEISISAGYVKANQCSNVGILRMDNFLDKVNTSFQFQDNKCKRNRKKITFFSFGPSTGIITAKPNNWPYDEENYLQKFCYATHTAMFHYAKNNPNLDVIIKPKWGGNWVEHIHKIAKKQNYELQKITNLKIEPELNVHNLLFESDVVIGFGSTTLLEASILGLPVIMPLYEEASEKKWQGWIQYRDWLGCFDIATSAEHLRQLIDHRLRNPEISDEMMTLRKRAFETFISSLNGSATQKLMALFEAHLELSNPLKTSVPRA